MARRRVLALLVTSLVLTALGGSAHAQGLDLPPPNEELGYADSWVKYMPEALMLFSGLIVVAMVVGYVAKAREFKANQKRGGAK